MTSESDVVDAETLRSRLTDILENFDRKLEDGELREQVRTLVPAHDLLSDLGSSLVDGSSARRRILNYLKSYPRQVISREELMVVAGISEWARRVRELRVEHGWSIVTGNTAKEMAAEDEWPLEIDATEMRSGDYVLLSPERDEEAADRWQLANDIRNRDDLGMRDRLLRYFRENVGKPITGERLKYVADDKSTWARRIRELRTERGWPISTHYSGRPDLPPGVYVLEEDRQLPAHDRKIPESVRRSVLQRDNHKCQDCGWTHDDWNRSDPRHLEVHHLVHHAEGGANEPENLVTLCNVCHDVRHRTEGT